MSTQQFTVKDAYKALEKNGFNHLRGRWFVEDFKGAIVGGCVLMQGAVNLGVQPNGGLFSLEDQLNKYRVNPKSKWAKNPTTKEPLFEGNLGLASVIIAWNDAVVPGEDEFVLSTYKAVAKMAKEVMEPYFDEMIELETREWNFSKKELVTV